MGDFSINMSCRLISREKNSCEEIPGKKKIPRMKEKYLSWRIKLEKKSYTVECQENNSVTKGL